MDRFFRGFLAGIAGGIIMTAWDLISFHLASFSAHRYLDWSAILLLGERPANFFEAAYALLVHLIWSGFLGIIFAFLVLLIGDEKIMLKGAILGFNAGFIFYAIPKLFVATTDLYATPIESVVSNHLGAVLWGLTAGYVLYYLDRKFTRETR